jgi:hypothetical protein
MVEMFLDLIAHLRWGVLQKRLWLHSLTCKKWVRKDQLHQDVFADGNMLWAPDKEMSELCWKLVGFIEKETADSYLVKPGFDSLDEYLLKEQ